MLLKHLISIGNEIVLNSLKECVNDLDYPVKNKIERAIKKIEKRINSQILSEKEEINTLESNPNLEIMLMTLLIMIIMMMIMKLKI